MKEKLEKVERKIPLLLSISPNFSAGFALDRFFLPGYIGSAFTWAASPLSSLHRIAKPVLHAAIKLRAAGIYLGMGTMGRKPIFIAAGMLLGITLAGCQQTDNSKIKWKDRQPMQKGSQIPGKQPGGSLQLPPTSPNSNLMNPGTGKMGPTGNSSLPNLNNQNSQYLTTPHQMPGTNTTQMKPGTLIPMNQQVPQEQMPGGMTIQQQAIQPPQNQLSPAGFQGSPQGPVSLNKLGSTSGGPELPPPPVPVGQPEIPGFTPAIPPNIPGNSGLPEVPPTWPNQ